MAIIENKLEKIFLIVIILFSVYSIQFAFDYSQNRTIFNIRDVNITGYDNETGFDSNTAIVEVPNILESIGGFALLQVSGAPFIINFVFGFIAFLLWLCLTVVIIAYIREMVGLT